MALRFSQVKKSQKPFFDCRWLWKSQNLGSGEGNIASDTIALGISSGAREGLEW